MSEDFLAGSAAYKAGKLLSHNPYIAGTTKRGVVKFCDPEKGSDWENGWRSAAPARIASDAEVKAAASVDVSRFGRRWRRA